MGGGGGGGSGIHYSLRFSPLFISLKFWVIHQNKTNYSLTIRKVAKKSDYSLFINFFFNSLKKGIIHKFLGPHYSLFFGSLFTIHYKKGPLFTNHYTPSRPSSIAEHFGIKRYRSVTAVRAIYPDAQTAETHLYLKLTSFCVNILIVLFRILILVQ